VKGALTIIPVSGAVSSKELAAPPACKGFEGYTVGLTVSSHQLFGPLVSVLMLSPKPLTPKS